MPTYGKKAGCAVRRRKKKKSIRIFTELPTIPHIPIEILAEIFDYCLRDATHLSPTMMDGEFIPPTLSVHPKVKTAPFYLSHVCTYWRDVALSTPMLWSRLSVCNPSRQLIPAVTYWLGQAGTCPLELTIRQYEGKSSRMRGDALRHILQEEKETSKTRDVIEEILYLFIRRAHQWRCISFLLSGLPQIPLLRLVESDVQVLESLSISLPSWDQASIDELYRVLYSSPALRRIRWDGYDFARIPALVPWAQLTHITICFDIASEELLEILRQCHQVVMVDIESLWLSPTTSETSPDSTTPESSICRVTLDHLHTLRIKTAVDAGLFLDRLTLPALEFIDIHHELFNGAPRYPHFLGNLLERSQCCLQNFSLFDLYIAEDDLLRYLALPCLVSVTSLKLSCRITDAVVAALMRKVYVPHGDIREGHTSNGGILGHVVTSLRNPYSSIGSDDGRRICTVEIKFGDPTMKETASFDRCCTPDCTVCQIDSFPPLLEAFELL